ncbi:2OG-Fe dioxygenase family protein [Thiomonas sp. FB-6]|uniref:2OG-Fe dioxygenase family protein n=1 Tax=Thiomonas sp. FB-6 TaxID=1158291 RepID=UPI0003634B3E|nr:2OG-Fe dioxygenase family protein [Thiomonas sp. FB-6]
MLDFDLGPGLATAARVGTPGRDLRDALLLRLREQGFALLQPAQLGELCGLSPADCAAALPLWEELPADPYLKDGGRYRRRRHGSFVHETAGAQPGLRQVAHRAHYQPLTYNALHGGLVRWLEPLDPRLCSMACWGGLLGSLGEVFGQVRPQPRWFVEAHQFRIDTADGIGRPTPEGAHRDGVDFVAVLLAQRRGIRGGESRVFELQGARGVRFTLDQPWSALLMDDTRVIHETTPILPELEGAGGCRDTLVLTWRAGGFLDPPRAEG